MHGSPAVNYPFDRSATPWRWLWACLLSGGAVGSSFAMQQPDARTLMILGAVWFVVMSVVVFAWVSARAGRLVWDGSEWRCTVWPDLVLGQVHIAMDFQARLVVSIKPAEGSQVQWLWLSREADPSQWHTLRCALVAARQLPAVYQ